MKEYKTIYTYTSKEIEELIKRAFAIKSPIAVDTDELKLKFNIAVHRRTEELIGVEVLIESI